MVNTTKCTKLKMRQWGYHLNKIVQNGDAQPMSEILLHIENRIVSIETYLIPI